MLKVKDLIKFLEKQDPEAYLFAYDLDCMDYRKVSKNIFKSAKQAKKDEICKWRRFFKELPKNEIDIRIKNEMKNSFRYCEDNDILMGLKK